MDQKQKRDDSYHQEREEMGTNHYEILKEVKFKLDTVSGDVHFFKHIFNNDKINEMNM